MGDDGAVARHYPTSMSFELALVWLHVSGNVFWIGGICGTGALLTIPTLEAKTRGVVALATYRQIATPGFLVSFVCGTLRLVLSPKVYLVEHHWMHGKLACALVVIALHHILGARAKRAASGSASAVGNAAPLSVALALAAVAAVFFAIVRVPN
jgi:putative membrane protein